MPNGNLTASQLAQARQASASVLGRFSGAEQFEVRNQSFAAPSSIQYRPFNLNRPLESILISLVVCSVAFQDDLKMRIATDPVPNFVIPVWCIVAYVIAAARAWRGAKP